jgi:AcrR family transcriptional regulator
MPAKAVPRAKSAHVTAKRHRRRDQVLDAAAAVFAAKGFHDATTRDIADRVGLLPGSLYYYFDSKEAALVAVCERTGRRYVEAMAGILDGPPPVARLLREAIRSHMVSNRRELVHVFAFRRHDLPGGAAARLARLAADYTGQWEALLARGVAAGEFPPSLDCARTAVAILSMCNGAVEWYQDRGDARIETVAADFADILLGGIAAERPAR